MKKYFFVLIILLASYSVYSQGFTFVRTSPQIVISTDTTDYEVASFGLLEPQTGTLNIRLVRRVNDLTSGWVPLGASICNYQNCFATTVDTIIAPYTAGGTDDTVSIHFYCYDVFLNRYVQGAGLVRMRAELVSNPSQFIEVDFRGVTQGAIGITQISSIIKEFALSQNYPNPFNPATKINFSIPKSEFVSLRVYDILGREVKALVSENLTPGEYEVGFNAEGLSSGMYYYSLRAGEYVSVKKMVLVK